MLQNHNRFEKHNGIIGIYAMHAIATIKIVGTLDEKKTIKLISPEFSVCRK